MVLTPTGRIVFTEQFTMTSTSILLIGIFTSLSIYLFATAPTKLPDVAQSDQMPRPIDVANLFNAMNTINDVSRRIYTSEIVGAGESSGLAFGEDWAEPGVEKGPLPALFLRLVASDMETRPPPLGLYLGSDQPINKSNLFTDKQAEVFEIIKTTGNNIFLNTDESGYVAMYPDLASAKACVTCHNEHLDSPKKDWRLNEVMGATTWTYPRKTLGAGEYLEITDAFYDSVQNAYQSYLNKAATFRPPIHIGNTWPAENRRALPDTETFMLKVRNESAAQVLDDLVLNAISRFDQSENK